MFLSTSNYILIYKISEKALAPHSCLENPMDGGAWCAAVHGIARVGHDFHFSLSCIGEGNGNPLQCSCLENPRDGGTWWAAIYGVAQSRTRLKRLSSSSIQNIDNLVSLKYKAQFMSVLWILEFQWYIVKKIFVYWLLDRNCFLIHPLCHVVLH